MKPVNPRLELAIWLGVAAFGAALYIGIDWWTRGAYMPILDHVRQLWQWLHVQ